MNPAHEGVIPLSLAAGIVQGKVRFRMTDPRTPRPSKPGSATRLRRWLPMLVLLLLAAAGYGFGLHHYLTLGALAEHRDLLHQRVDEQPVAALAIFMLLYIAVVALSVPGASVMSIAGGLLFGWMISVPATVVAASCGASIVFAIVKTSLGAALAERASPLVGRLAGGFARNGFSLLLFLRLTPVFPFWAVNAVAGLSRMPFRTFLAATALGIIPASFAFALIGAGLDRTIDDQLAAYEACVAAQGASACSISLDASDLLSPELAWGFAGLGLVALLPLLLSYARRSPL
jgi:uncharacterized membrane protein YdjX (TVP38/TMEM64 family)